MNSAVSSTGTDYLEIIPRRIRREEDSDFFMEGNMGRLLSISCVPSAEEERLQMESKYTDTDINVLLQMNDNLKGFSCRWPRCEVRFTTLGEYDEHIRHVHSHCCKICARSFPIHHLLDIHITETHDSYFAAQVSRGTKTDLYVCFVQECSQKFATSKMRQEHLKRHHLFRGASFSWILGSAAEPSPFRTNSDSEARRKKEGKSSVESVQEGSHSCSACGQRKGRKAFSANQLRKKAAGRASTCKECLVRHGMSPATDEAEKQATEAAAVRMDVDNVSILTDRLERVSLHVPHRINFGRRGGGRDRVPTARPI